MNPDKATTSQGSAPEVKYLRDGRPLLPQLKKAAREATTLALKSPVALPSLAASTVDLGHRLLAGVMALVIVAGGVYVSDLDRAQALYESLNGLGSRLGGSIELSYLKLANAVEHVGGAYLAAVYDAGERFFLVGSAATSATHDMAESYVAAVGATGERLAAVDKAAAAVYDAFRPVVDVVTTFFSSMF